MDSEVRRRSPATGGQLQEQPPFHSDDASKRPASGDRRPVTYLADQLATGDVVPAVRKAESPPHEVYSTLSLPGEEKLYQFILVEADRGVLKITLNRPEVLNSFTLAMSKEVRLALETARADKAIRAVLITGAGRGFCAGQDLTDVPAAVEGKMDLGTTVVQT
jgi:hypothetical protein